MGKYNEIHPRKKLRKARERLDGRVKAWAETRKRVRYPDAYRQPGSMKNK